MKIHYLSCSICLIMVLSFFSANVSAQQNKAKPTVPVGQEQYKNSRHAQSIVEVYAEISSKISKIKKDPFDPTYEKKQETEIFNQYIDKLIFIPSGKESMENNQGLAGLDFRGDVKELRSLFYKSKGVITQLSYLTTFDRNICDGGGFDRLRGYMIYAEPLSIQSGISDFGVLDFAGSYYNEIYRIKIKDFEISAARSLSGNVERYVKFHSITSIYKNTGKGQSGDRCYSNDELIDVISSANFTLEYYDKLSGKIVLKLENR